MAQIIAFPLDETAVLMAERGALLADLTDLPLPLVRWLREVLPDVRDASQEQLDQSRAVLGALLTSTARRKA